MKTLTLALLFFVSTLGLTAQQTEKEVPNIEVRGKAQMDIMPDEIYVTINISERTEGRDKITVEAQEKKLKEGLMEIGISLDLLTLSDSESDYVKISWGRKEVITRKQFSLKLSTAEEVSKTFKKLDEIKIDDAFIARVDHSNIIELKKQLRIDAIKAAKEKADYLLTAIGEETGHALEVREIDLNAPISRYANTTRYYANSTIEFDSVDLPEVGFRKIKIEAEIYVKFEIKQD